MATLKEAIYAILSADAQLDGSSNLGDETLLAQPSTAPYGIYWRHPPENVDFNTYNVITFFFSVMT